MWQEHGEYGHNWRHHEGHHGYGMGFRPGMFGFGMRMGFRRFLSRDEIISQLEEYLKELQAEARAVQERIDELKKKGEPD